MTDDINLYLGGDADINLNVSEGDNDIILSIGDDNEAIVLAIDGMDPTAFIDDTDTPSSYSGQANKVLRVNSTETGIEFVLDSVLVQWGEITGTLSDQTDLQAALDLKYDAADFNTDWDNRLATKTTDNLTEGSSNFYDKTVVLTDGNGIDITGIYPTFTITVNESEIDHVNILSIGTNTHVQIDSHIADGSIHFSEASIDHTAIQNIGTNTHAQIDTHIANTSNPHSVSLEQARAQNNQVDGPIDMNSNLINNLSTPISGADAVTKDYVDSLVNGLDWQDSVLSFINLVTSEPGSPTLGDRYINTATGNSSVTTQAVTADYIYEWNGSSWTESVTNEGYATWVEDEDVVYVYNSSWVKFGTTVTHNNLIGLQGGTANEFYHLTSAEHGDLSGGDLGSLTEGSVLFMGASGIAQDNTNFFYDNLNDRLGLGTTSPDRLLHTQTSEFASIPLFERSGQTSDAIFVGAGTLATKTSDMGDEFGSLFGFHIQDDADVINPIGYVGAVRAGADNTGDLIFSPITAGAVNERMRIEAGGNLGIGTSTPRSLLDVAGQEPVINLTCTDTSITSANILGRIKFGGIDDGNFEYIGAEIRAKSQATWGTTQISPAELEFYTTRNASNQVPLHRWTIKENAGGVGGNLEGHATSRITTTTGDLLLLPDGNVGINNTNPSVDLDVAGQVYAESSSFPVMGFRRISTVNGNGTFSDLTGIASAMALYTETNVSSLDGTGGGIVFYLTDTSGGDGPLARIYARRDGGDNIGALQIWTGNNGQTHPFTFRADGTFGIGTTSPSELLEVSGNVFLTSDSDKLLLGAAKDMEIYYSGLVGTIDTSLIAPSDLLIDCGTDKTIELQETVYCDYVTPLGPNNWNGVSNNPVLTKLFDDGSGSQGVYAFVFSDGDEALITIQMPHSWKEGTTIQPHIHFMTTSDVSPADNFGIEFEYSWVDIGEDFPANSTLETNDISTGINSDIMHQAAHITATGIDGTGHTISSVLLCRIKRVAATGDNYGDGVAILDFDIHFEMDTIGSRQEFIK